MSWEASGEDLLIGRGCGSGDRAREEVVAMFTGLIADLGTLEALERGDEGARLRIATRLAAELAEGDSVAVNGAA